MEEFRKVFRAPKRLNGLKSNVLLIQKMHTFPPPSILQQCFFTEGFFKYISHQQSTSIRFAADKLCREYKVRKHIVIQIFSNYQIDIFIVVNPEVLA